MIKILVAVCLLWSVFACAYPRYYNENSTLCPCGCSNCYDNLTCRGCIYWFGITPWGTCVRCVQSYCAHCSYNPIYTNICTRCSFNYGLNTLFPPSCLVCSTSTASECASVNNCTLAGTCLNCFQAYAIKDGICRMCNQTYQRCSYCNSVQCLTCNNYYYLNYSSSSKECVPCSTIPHCSKCTHGPSCYECQTGYYLQAGRCKQCVFPCLTCDSSIICTSCYVITHEYMLINSTCFKCSDVYQTRNCTLCSLTFGNYSCYGCEDYFYLNLGACDPCISPCLTCSTAVDCSSCVNMYYGISGSTCQLCGVLISNCTLCYNSSVCIKCEPEYTFHYINQATIDCIHCDLVYNNCSRCDDSHCLICQEGYSLNTDTLQCEVIQCNPPCYVCKFGQPSLCLSCIEGYFYNTSAIYTCSLCPAGCTACKSETLCTHCLPNYFNNNGDCQLCPLGTYFSEFGEICANCPSHCLTCDTNNCFSCEELFSISSQSERSLCTDTCGDGLQMENECDIVPSSLPDGCSDECRIEPDFTCTSTPSTYNSSNGTLLPVNTSTCSYVGRVSISNAAAKQQLFSNTVQLTFKIQPYLQGMPLSSDSQAYLQSIFSLNSTANLSSVSVEVDESAGTVSFTVHYLQDLSSSDFTLEINFAALALSSPVLQYMTNQSHSFAFSQLKLNGCLGELFEQQALGNAKTIYYCSMGLSFVGLVLLLLGLFTKELAGLEQMLLFQTIFASLLFSPDKVTLPVLSLSGFRYSLDVGLPHSRNMLASSSAYLLEVDGQTLASCYIINFLFYLLPLGALLWLLYRLRNKDFPYKAEIGRHSEDFFRGQLLLYVALFNLLPLIVFSRLFITLQDDFYFWDLVLAVSSVLLTLWALYNYCFRPEIVGIFRSAFRLFSDSKEQTGNRTCGSLIDCLCQRFCEGSLGDCYSRYITNHYFLFIGYLIVSGLVIALAASNRSAVLTALQSMVLLVLVTAKPYFNKAEKFRSILMFSTLLASNFISAELGGAFIMPLVLIGLCSLHCLICICVLIESLIQQIKRRFNDRSQIVKKMCRQQQQRNAADNDQKEQIQKQALRQLIVRFNNSHNSHLPSFSRDIGHQAKVSIADNEANMNNEVNQMDGQNIKLKEEVIIQEENQHLRYQRGLDFFDKYGRELAKDLIKEHYDQI